MSTRRILRRWAWRSVVWAWGLSGAGWSQAAPLAVSEQAAAEAFLLVAAGQVHLQWRDAKGRTIQTVALKRDVTPETPVVLDDELVPPAGAHTAVLLAPSGMDRAPGELDSTEIGRR